MSDTMVVEDQIVSITPEQKNRKSDGQAFTLYRIETAKGLTLETFKREVAESAHNTSGQPALLTVKVEQNGEYVNRYLQMAVVKPTSEVGYAMASAMQAHAQALPTGAESFTTYTPGGGSVANGNPIAQTRPEGPAQKDIYIWRQTATKVSAHLSKTDGEFWANVGLLLAFYETGRPPTYPQAPQAQQAAPAQPQSNLPTLPQPSWPQESPTPVPPAYPPSLPDDGIPF